MDRFESRYVPANINFEQTSKFLRKRYYPWYLRHSTLFLCAGVALLVFLAYWLKNNTEINVRWVYVCFVGLYGGWWYFACKRPKAKYFSDFTNVPAKSAQTRFELTSDGFRLENEHYTLVYRWTSFLDVDYDAQGLVVLLSPVEGIPLPDSSFSDADEKREVWAFIKNCINEARE